MKKNKKKQSLLIIALVAVVGIMSIAFALNATTNLFLGADVTTKEVKWEVAFKPGDNGGLEATAAGFELTKIPGDHGIVGFTASATGGAWEPGDSETIAVTVVNNGDYDAYFNYSDEAEIYVEDVAATDGKRDVSDLFEVTVSNSIGEAALVPGHETTVTYTITYNATGTFEGNDTYGVEGKVYIDFFVPFTAQNPNVIGG